MSIWEKLPWSCPACQYLLKWQADDGQNGWLDCSTCLSRTPVIDGFCFFTEADMDTPTRPNLAELRKKWMGTAEGYQTYMQEKIAKGVVESYAAFHPFNESARCLAGILPSLRQHLRPGDIILDLYNRTGFSGAWLAGQFPEQIIMSCWDGNSSVLGYQGYHYWFASDHRPINLFIVFTPPNQPFPVQTHSIRYLHAHDCLHRYRQPQFLNECLRVCEKDGVLTFLHVHMANNEPEPWFERPGTKRHGKAYSAWFAQKLANDSRIAVIRGEPDVFLNAHRPQYQWQNHADTGHYNGVILVSQSEFLEQIPKLPTTPIWNTHDRLIINPLIRINPLTGIVELDPQGLNGGAKQLFEGHAVYRKFLTERLPICLQHEAISLLKLAESGLRIDEINQRSGECVDHILQLLIDKDIAIPVPIGLVAYRMQRFHCNGQSIVDADLERCWNEWVQEDPTAMAGMVMGETICRTEADRIVKAFVTYFSELETPSHFLGICTQHPDMIWVALGAIGAGKSLIFPDEQKGSGDFDCMVTEARNIVNVSQLFIGEIQSHRIEEVLEAYLEKETALMYRMMPSEKDWSKWVFVDKNRRLNIVQRK